MKIFSGKDLRDIKMIYTFDSSTARQMNLNAITPETLERFESLPRVHKSKIINRMIFYKSCYGTPTGRSEKGLFETVAFKHIATLCPTCSGSGEIEKMDYNLVCMDCLGSGSLPKY